MANLQIQILIGIALGALTGLFLGEYAMVFSPLGTAFVMLLKMSVLPLMSCALIHAVARLSIAQAKRMLKGTVLSLMLVWALVLMTIYGIACAFPEGFSPSFIDSLPTESEPQESLLNLFIPINVINALANDIVPGVVFFSLLFAVALMRLRKKRALLETLDVIVKALSAITDWITRLSPIGAFALIAVTAGTLPVEEFSEIRLYFLAYVFGMCTLVFVTFPLVVEAITPVHGRRFLAEIRPAFLLAFTTGNTIIALPHILRGLRNLAREYRLPEDDADQSSESVVPIAYNFPTVGNLFVFLYMLFAAFFFALPLGFSDHARLVTLGLPVLFGSGSVPLNAVAFLLDNLQMPLDGIALYVQTMPLTRNFQMLGSSTGIALVGLLAMFAYCGRIQVKRAALAKAGVGSIAALTIGVIVIRLFSVVQPQDYPIFHDLTIASPVKSRIVDGNYPARKEDNGGDRLAVIQQSQELRVGFNPELLPFAYLNARGELVGYDIAFAHDLARSLGVSLTFVPFSYGELATALSEGKFDIAMAATSVTPARMKELSFSEVYLTVSRVLIVEDFRRHEFASYERIRNRRDLTICVLAGSSLVEVLRQEFPFAERRELKSIDEFLKPGAGDALLWTAAAGTSWSLMNPRYTVLTTDHSLGKEHYGYALPPGEERLREFVNQWLDIRKLDGFSADQYAYWVEGGKREGAPRWSIIRDVLHWVN